MAEGLIPYIYRAIKRMRREQKYYRSLSTGPSDWFGLPSSHPKVLRPPAIKLGSFSEGGGAEGETSGRHRRYRSMQDFYYSADDAFSQESSGRRPAKEMARFGSSRSRSRVFSCVTGVN
ncbi:uncharacterized protein LOC141819860 [Curcuma longa]|uniref:uncharacterized protein LOC141819860 n=1 Tax=Curcuma longa TaxID=136217 RepID=UPI003D9F8EF8